MTTQLSGQKTVAAAGTAERMPDIKGSAFIISPLSTNTNPVFIGNDGSTSNQNTGDVSSSTGYAIGTSSTGIIIEVHNLNALYLDVTTNGEGVQWLRIA